MTNENQLICGLTDLDLQELKAKYGHLVLVTIKDGEEAYDALFKEPTFKVLEIVQSLSGQGKGLESIGVVWNNCKVACDAGMDTRDVLKIKAVEALMLKTQEVKAEAKNV